jgi:hypothetical protein
MPSTTPSNTRASALAALQALISGLQKQLPSATLTLENAPYTTVALVTLLQSVIDALNAVTAAEAASRAAVANARAVVSNAGPVTRSLRRTLISMFGNAPQTLMLFGLTPPKAKAPRTSAQNAAAAAKAKATRIARGTASAKAKSAIKGNVTGLQMTPITAPASPEPAPPAPPAVTPSAPAPGTSGK